MKQINEVQKFTDIKTHVYEYVYIFCKLDMYILHVYFIQCRLYVQIVPSISFIILTVQILR